MELQKASILRKAKFTKKWRGKDGKWNYEYGSKKIKVKVKDQLGNVEEVDLDRNDPLAQMYIKRQEKKHKSKQEVLSKLKKLNIKTMEDIDKYIKKGESRYSTLKRLVGESTADIIMRNLEVRSYK